VEGGVAVTLLLAMTLVASYASLLYALAHAQLTWAGALLNRMGWADGFLTGATFWIAFLGASLAARQQEHIALDRVLREAPPRARYQLRAIAGCVAGLVTAVLAVAVWKACVIALGPRPIEIDLLMPKGRPQLHVCDATDEQLASVPDLERPLLTCAVRALLRALSLPFESPENAFLLIAPVMLAVIALRLLAEGVRCGLAAREPGS
jgi:hypothetical protein